jgi:MYXO-CTERM domain-containing protein
MTTSSLETRGAYPPGCSQVYRGESQRPTNAARREDQERENGQECRSVDRGGGTGIFALAAFAAYRWRQRRRILQVKEWVKDYLLTRYGEVPGHLDINCSDDSLWPVLVGFDMPRIGVRCRLRFACQGSSSLFLLSEKEDPC